MSELYSKRPEKEGMELQLTAMIDIFSMIVIFLILGSVFGASEMVIPSGMTIPQSVSHESADTAPRLVISADGVNLSVVEGTYPLDGFRGASAGDEAGGGAAVANAALRQQLRQQLKQQIDQYIARIPEADRAKKLLLNVIADQNAPYRDVFDVVKYFREAGFGTLLFVAEGERKKASP